MVVAKLTAAEGYLGQVDFAATTNALGQFRFGDLPTGTYTLRIDPQYLQSSGFTSATPTQVTAGVQAARDMPNTDFTLGGGSPGPGPGPGPGGAGDRHPDLPAGAAPLRAACTTIRTTTPPRCWG